MFREVIMSIHKYFMVLVILGGLYAYSQTLETRPPAATQNSEDETEVSTATASEDVDDSAKSSDAESIMQVPDPVNPAGYSMISPPETARSNYLDLGLSLMGAYDDNVIGGIEGRPVQDVSYSVRPMVSWRQSSPRILWNLMYSPGFTFYQHTSSLNAADHNFSLGSQFRLSPHVTLVLHDGFSKTSNPAGQFYQSAGIPTGIAQPSAATIISPLADQINNTGSVEVTYQFDRNSMLGASGIFSNLHYLDRSQVPGLFDSNMRAAQAFYSHRVSKKHYVGIRYEFQSLLSTPNPVTTETHSLVLFYAIYLQPRMSLSMFAGPQRSDTAGGAVVPTKMWSPSYGGSFVWQGVHTAFAIAGSQTVGAGGGLQGASKVESANASVRRQLTKVFSAEVGASYSNTGVLASLPQFSSGGRNVSSSVSLQRRIRDYLDVGLAYTRLHQNYGDIEALANNPNRNSVSVSLSYQFQRPIGR
jgi:hypothetical protein